MENDKDLALEPRLYEVGYHILPTVAEEDIPGQTTALRNAIESRGGNVVGDGMPSMVALAYPLPKVLANKRKTYTSAFFGWMKFEMTPDQTEGFKKDLEGNENILRFLIVKAVKDKPVVPSEKMAFMSDEGEKKPEVETKKDDASSAELDKTIDDLVIE
jgi:ribosomal protein S6